MRFSALVLPVLAIVAGFLSVMIHEYQVASFCFGATVGSILNAVVCLPVRQNGDQW